MRRLLLPVAVGALLLGATACGGSDEPSSDGSPTATVTETPTGSASPSPEPSSADPSATIPCRTTVLRVSLADSEGAAGSTYSQLTLTNTGTSACTTGGYGGVSYAGGEAGAQIGAAADREAGDGAVQRIVLEPGQSASARLREVAAGNFGAARCRPTQVYALKVFPPNETEATFVKRRTTGCANPAVHLLSIQPYVKS